MHFQTLLDIVYGHLFLAVCFFLDTTCLLNHHASHCTSSAVSCDAPFFLSTSSSLLDCSKFLYGAALILVHHRLQPSWMLEGFGRGSCFSSWKSIFTLLPTSKCCFRAGTRSFLDI
ncbi:hypothetical protein VIGAN_09128800 [Vigna angularis var. angularis]|uniref:Uncharacterized protein n=1 Tax=Vigna angularis var. angularis TaxID=157739 RepID=A0A0S3SXW4_PHAAN|nr:hypothetical protein VIGAN_09128800 [Vigna angularis var. angularis]